MEYVIAHQITASGTGFEYTSYLTHYYSSKQVLITESTMNIDHAKKYPTWHKAITAKRGMGTAGSHWRVQRYQKEEAPVNR